MVNEQEVRRSAKCGCFHCEEVFSAVEVNAWLDDRNGRTALCPHCGIDSVIGDAAGYPATDAGFLRSMPDHYFAASTTFLASLDKLETNR